MDQSSIKPILSLSWQSVAYGIGVFGRQLILFITIPFFTRFMPQEVFGVISVLTSTFAFINVLTNAGLPAATFRIYNDSEDDRFRRRLLGSSQLLFFLFALILALILFFFASPIAETQLGSEEYASIIQMLAFLLLLETMINYGYILLRLSMRPLVTSLHNLLLITCQLGIALIFVLLNWGIFGYYIGLTLGAVIGLLIMVWLVRDMLSFQVARKQVQELIAYGLPLVPTTLSMWALGLIDRNLVAYYSGLEQVAIYEIGYKIGLMVSLVAAAFNTAWAPFSFSVMNKNNARKIFRDVLTFITFVYLYLALAVFAFNSELVMIMSPPIYSSATLVVPWVVFSQVFYRIYPVISIGPKIVKRTSLLAYVAMGSAALNIILNIILIPWIGIVGAAIATFIGYGALTTVTYLVGQRVYTFQVDWNRMFKLLFAGLMTAAILAQYARLERSQLENVFITGLLLLIFPIILILTRFITVYQGKELWRTGTSLLSGRLKRA